MNTSTRTTPPCSPSTRFVPQRDQESLDSKLKRRVAAQLPWPESYPSPPMSDHSSPPTRLNPGGVEDKGSIARGPGGADGGRGDLRPSFAGMSATQAPLREQRLSSAYEGSVSVDIPGVSDVRGAPGAEPSGQAPGAQPTAAGSAVAVSSRAGAARPGEKLRPSRRSKAHVPAACGNCKKAHLACDIQRPCTRCVLTGKQATCKNVEHKKRGRPRLREERETKAEPVEGPVPAPGPAPAAILPAPAVDPYGIRHRRVDSFQVLRSHRDRVEGQGQEQEGTILRPTTSYFQRHSEFGFNDPRPVAFLNLNLEILKANRIFQDLFGPISDGSGKKIAHFLESRHEHGLQTLETELRQERQHRDENYLPPISGAADLDAVQRISEGDIDRVSHGFHIRSYPWTFVFPNGQTHTLLVTVRLAKTTSFFVVLVLPPPPRPESRPITPYAQVGPPNFPPPSFQSFSFPSPQPGPPQYPSQHPPPSPFSSFQNLGTSLPPTSPALYPHGMPPPLSRASHPYQTYQPPSNQPAPSMSLGTQPPPRQPQQPPRREEFQLPPLLGPGRQLLQPRQHSSPSGSHRENVRRRESTPVDSAEQSDPPGSHKRRRLDD